MTKGERLADDSTLAPIPTSQPACADERQGQEQQKPPGKPQTTAASVSHTAGRAFRSSESVSSSTKSASAPPQQQQQQQQQPKRFSLRDGARDAIATMKQLAEDKQMVVAEPLYGFYHTEINLHFLNALSAYFIRVAKDIHITRQRQRQQQIQPQSGAGGGGEDRTNKCEGRERAKLLREVGRSYGRVIMYCSNFERTTADAQFFESLMCLARLVVAAAVAESSLSPEVDREFDRIFRGGVFHPAPSRPAPRPRTCTHHSSPSRQGTPATPHSASMHGRQASPLGSVMERRSGIGSAHYHGPTTTPPTGPKSSREAVGGAVSGGKSVHSRPRKGHRGGASPSSPGRHPSPLGGDLSGHAGGNGGRGRRVMGGRSTSGSKQLGRAMIGEGSKAGAPREAHAAVGGGEGEDEDSGAAAPFPGFDELSRWRVTRGSVSKMVRLAGEAQQVALSNLNLAEAYRLAVATKFWKKPCGAAAVTATAAAAAAVGRAKRPARFSPASPAATASGGSGSGSSSSSRSNNNNNTNADNGGVGATDSQPHSRTQQPQQEEGARSKESKRRGVISASPPPSDPAGVAAIGEGRAPFWKRRGRALTTRNERGKGGTDHGHGDKEFFCADALSLCIASVVEPQT